MNADVLTAAPAQSPANQLLDGLVSSLELKNDAALSRALEVAPPVISKIRHGRLTFGDSMIIRAHELTGWPVRKIKELLGKPSLAQRAA